ncbi:MAG: GNAT family N-acetyltransferase [Candidatus Xenobiia bacterium LiM19]
MNDAIETLDLARSYDESLLDVFHNRLYMPAFPIQDEREELSSWKQCLAHPAESGTETHIILAGYHLQDKNPVIAGGVVVEYYLGSQVSLLTYIVVASEFRGRGLARRLVKEANEEMKAAAERINPKNRPLAYFAESNDPASALTSQDSQDPYQRLMLLSRLGYYEVDFPYIQPRLEGRSNRYYGLKLLAHRASWGEDQAVLNEGAAHFKLESSIVRSFINDLYTVLEGPPSLQDRDYKGMMDFLDERKALFCRPLHSRTGTQ